MANTGTRIRRVLHGQVLLGRLLWECSPALTVVGIVAALAQAAAAAGVMIGSGRLVQALAHGRLDTTWLVVTLACLLAQPVCSAAMDVVGSVEQGRATPLLLERASALCSRPHGIEHLENAEIRQSVDGTIEEINQQYFLGVQSTWQVLGYRLWGFAALLVLASWSWWVAALVLAATLALNVTWSAYSQELFEQIFRDRRRRRARWYRNLLVEQDNAKEVRLFGLTSFGIERFVATWSEALTDLWRDRRRKQRPIIACNIAILAAYVVALAALGHGAWTGAVSTATLLASAQALSQIDGLGMLGDMQTMVVRQQTLLLDLEDLSSRLPEPTPLAAVTRPTGTASAVAFRGVRFGYPGRPMPTFDGLSLEIDPGSSVAVVGANGAGKSTLIKLLCGLHRPDAGLVTVDGGDPGEDDHLRRRVAVIFQEFVRYHLTLRENVAMAMLADHRDEDISSVVRRALHDATGDPVLARVGDWDRVLSAEYAGGTDLSGGQWQRVALARALAAIDAGAGVLVLDEPTAALDVRAEAELFDNFLTVTRGLTTILVSHRLSSVRHADRIVVLDGGRIVEDGSHDDLVAAGNGYAQMFALQAERFAVAGGVA
jgi:ATP-binding cassette subfamily B protein